MAWRAANESLRSANYCYDNTQFNKSALLLLCLDKSPILSWVFNFAFLRHKSSNNSNNMILLALHVMIICRPQALICGPPGHLQTSLSLGLQMDLEGPQMRAFGLQMNITCKQNHILVILL